MDQENSRDKWWWAAEESDAVSDYSVKTSLTVTSETTSQEPPLSWRIDPAKSFSDWTIEIRVRNNNASHRASTIDIYDVHRAILAIGPRKSGYFASLFYCGVDDTVTQIELSDKAASHFPAILDYVYSSETFQITTGSAVALGFLAQCFMITTLQKEVQVFIQEDLSFSNIGTYMTEAIHFKDEATSTRAMDICVEEVMQRCANSPLRAGLLLCAASSMAHGATRYQPLWNFLTRFPHVVVARARNKQSSLAKRNLDKEQDY
jgi:hypothetical protein